MKTKNIIIVAVLFALVLLVGCATTQPKISGGAEPKQAEASVVEKSTTPQDQTAPATEATAAAQPSYELTQETTDKLNAKFNIATSLVISDNARKMKFGDSYVFAIGVTNTQQVTDTFLVQAELKKAYSGYGNLLFENRSLASTWIEKNQFQTFTLGKQEQKIFPFIIEIKNLLDGAKPNPGIYEFTIKVLRQSGRSYPVYDYDSEPIVITLES